MSGRLGVQSRSFSPHAAGRAALAARARVPREPRAYPGIRTGRYSYPLTKLDFSRLGSPITSITG
jgi:hypothetical protein